jgi:hypothetical protein
MREWRYRAIYSYSFHWMEASGKFHVPAVLPPMEEAPITNWVGGWVGLSQLLWTLWTREKLLAAPGNRTIFLGHIACRLDQSLYRPSYSDLV